MQISVLWWVVYTIWVVLGLWNNWPAAGSGVEKARGMGGVLVLYGLVGALGWKCFGPAIHQ